MSGRRTELPAMPDCTGCGECCTVVKVRPDEAKRIRHHVRTNGVEWSPPEHQPEDWASRGDEGPNRYCGFLRVDGWRYRCAVYDVRPWSCRAFGVVKGMACSYFPELAVSGPAPLAAVMRRLVDPDVATWASISSPVTWRGWRRISRQRSASRSSASCCLISLTAWRSSDCAKLVMRSSWSWIKHGRCGRTAP